MVPTCPNLPFFFYVFLLLNLLFSKKHLVVMIFSSFVQFLGWLGGCGSYLFYSKGSGHLTPRILREDEDDDDDDDDADDTTWTHNMMPVPVLKPRPSGIEPRIVRGEYKS